MLNKHIVLAIMALTIFSINPVPVVSQEGEPVGMADPSAVYCKEQGGTLETIQDIKGEAGMCTLPDGTVCGTWAYFRGECPPSDESILLKAEASQDLVFGPFCDSEYIQTPQGILVGDIAMIGRTFTINYDDETFDIMVFNCGNEAESLAFKPHDRYIVIDGVGSKQVDVLLPSRLINGEFTILGYYYSNFAFELFTPEEYSSNSGFDLSKVSEEYLMERGLELLISEEPINVIRINEPPESTIAIQGTTAIPEFPVAMIMLAVIMLMTILFSSKIKGNVLSKKILSAGE